MRRVEVTSAVGILRIPNRKGNNFGSSCSPCTWGKFMIATHLAVATDDFLQTVQAAHEPFGLFRTSILWRSLGHLSRGEQIVRRRTLCAASAPSGCKMRLLSILRVASLKVNSAFAGSSLTLITSCVKLCFEFIANETWIVKWL